MEWSSHNQYSVLKMTSMYVVAFYFQGVPYTSAKKRKAMGVGFVGFDSQEQLTKSSQVQCWNLYPLL